MGSGMCLILTFKLTFLPDFHSLFFTLSGKVQGLDFFKTVGELQGIDSAVLFCVKQSFGNLAVA